MITTFYPPYNFGGDGIFVRRLAEALARRGHHVTVIHCVDAYRLTGSPEPVDAVAHHPNIEVHPLGSGAGFLPALVTHQLGVPGPKRRAIRRVFAGTRFDVVHFHNISLVGGPAILAYGNAVKLYTAHEYWLVCPLSTLWKFSREPCAVRSCTTCTLRARRPPQLWRHTGLLARNLRHLDATMSPSRFLIRKHHEMGCAAEFIHVPNFVPDSDESPSDVREVRTAKVDRPFFLVVGRLERSKGVHDAIEVFRRFTGADLVIVGAGTHERELRAMAAGFDHIRFLGAMSYEGLIGLYRDAVAVIVPSIWYEPFGLVVIEAHAQRTPVIVSNAGALPELIDDGGGGMVYHDQVGLRRAVESLLDDPDRRDELGRRGYDAYRQLWTEERYLDRYFGLIEEIRARKRRAASLGE